MDAITSVLGKVFGGGGGGGALGQTMGLATGPLSLMQMISQMSLASKEKSALDREMWWAKNPQAISGLVTQMTQPLSQGLVKGTENIVNASLAQQGLSQAPGIQSQVLAQALAPYQQNEQQMALTEALKAIGLPGEALANIANINNPNALAMLLKTILPNPQTPLQVQGGAIPQAADPTAGITIGPPPFDPVTGLPSIPGAGPSIYGGEGVGNG